MPCFRRSGSSSSRTETTLTPSNLRPALRQRRPQRPSRHRATRSSAAGPETYTVKVNGTAYVVEVAEGGDISEVKQAPAAGSSGAAPAAPAASCGETIDAPLAGNIFKVNVKPGDSVAEGDVVVILEAMKMETEVRAAAAGTVSEVRVAEGDSVSVGDTLIVL